MEVATKIAKAIVTNGFRNKKRRATDCTPEESPHLSKIRELSERIQLSDLSEEAFIEDGLPGPAENILVDLYQNHQIAVARLFIRSGLSLEGCAHYKWEMLIVYSGSVCVQEDNNERILKASDHYYSISGIAHTVKAMEDSWLLVVTIPPSKMYSQGG